MILSQFTPGAWGIWTGVIMLGGWFLREYRETRKLSSDDREARRTGYAAQVEQLLKENRDLRNEMRDIRDSTSKEHKECRDENTELRALVIKLEDQVTALRRKIETQAQRISQLVNRR